MPTDYEKGFSDALNRVWSYANCIGGERGDISKWFAKNCLEFKPQRCAECDCKNGGSDCNWIMSSSGKSE